MLSANGEVYNYQELLSAEEVRGGGGSTRPQDNSVSVGVYRESTVIWASLEDGRNLVGVGVDEVMVTWLAIGSWALVCCCSGGPRGHRV